MHPMLCFETETKRKKIRINVEKFSIVFQSQRNEMRWDSIIQALSGGKKSFIEPEPVKRIIWFQVLIWWRITKSRSLKFGPYEKCWLCGKNWTSFDPLKQRIFCRNQGICHGETDNFFFLVCKIQAKIFDQNFFSLHIP